MTPQDRVQLVKQTIEGTIKSCGFTFDNLRIEMEQKLGGAEVTIKFTLNDYGNNSQILK